MDCICVYVCMECMKCMKCIECIEFSVWNEYGKWITLWPKEEKPHAETQVTDQTPERD